ncbi:MAG: peptidase domain-containing ABC transporter [Geminicoccales bacterium]
MSASLTLEAWGGGQAPDRFVRSLAHDDAGDLCDLSDYARCLKPLMSALGWRGQTQHLIEIMPHCADKIDLLDLRNILANANYQSRPLKTKLNELDARLLPCLFVTAKGLPQLILGRDSDTFQIYDPAHDQHLELENVPSKRGVAYIFERVAERDQKRTRQTDNWCLGMLGRFRKQLFLLALAGFVATLPGLLSPIFIMVLYDTVIAAQSTALLVQLTLSTISVLLVDLLFRLVRAKVMAYIATRIGRLVATSVFSRLMELAPAALSQAPLHAQVRRVRQFESWRDHFADPIVAVAFNLPFSVLFLVVIALLGGSLVFLPILVMGGYAGLAWLAGPALEKHSADASEARQQRDACFDEIMSDMRSVRLLASDDIWLERFRNFAAGSALAGAKRARLQDLLSQLGQGAVTVAGTGTLIVGAIQAMNGDLSLGALIACMALVWRVLSPWQQGIALLPRIAQLKNEIRLLNQTMRLPAEAENRPRRLAPSRRCGSMEVEGITLTYQGSSRPALMGIDLSIQAGETIAFVGGSGAGKSSLLKVMAGIYAPQIGSMRIDGFDLRQLHPRELRERIAYVPQQPHFYTGTIAQNLRLARPAASDEDVWNAAIQAGVLEDIQRLENGFETRIGDATVRQQSPGFLQRLSLARAYLKETDIAVFDEPGRALDSKGDQAFLQVLSRLRGRRTILVVTHRPSHLKLADQVFVLEGGRLKPGGPSLPQAAVGR